MRRYNHVERFPSDIDAENVQATCENGVLTLQIPGNTEVPSSSLR